MIVFNVPLLFLFYAVPPNSQLLIREHGNGPILLAFDVPKRPQGFVKSKCSIKQNVLRITFCEGPFH